MNTLINRLAAEWKTNPVPGFGDKAYAEIMAYKPTEKPGKITLDISGLSMKAVSFSRLKKLCLASDWFHVGYEDAISALTKYYPDDPDWKEWMQTVSLTDLVLLQRRYRSTAKEGLKQALSKVPLIRPELTKLKLNLEDSMKRQTLTNRALHKKLDNTTKFEWVKLQPVLLGLTSKLFVELIPALLLATGRRTCEIMKTASFSPVEGKPMQALFSGQCKTTMPVPYVIDLLAPFEQVHDGLAQLRSICDCKEMSPTMIHCSYRKKVADAVKLKVPTNPHTLRALNAVICEKLYNKDELSFIGYIKKQLGHTDVGSSTRYQCVAVDMTIESKEETRSAFEPLTHWGHDASPAAIRCKQMMQIMKEGSFISLYHFCRTTKASPPLVKKLIAYGDNARIINEHNDRIAIN